MKKTQTLFLAGILCILALVSMVLALIFGRTHTQSSSFTPPPFDSSAESGIPAVSEELGWTEIYQDGMAFKCSICGNVIASGRRGRCVFYQFLRTGSLAETPGPGRGRQHHRGNRPYKTRRVCQIRLDRQRRFRRKFHQTENHGIRARQTYYSAGAVTLNTQIRKEAA